MAELNVNNKTHVRRIRHKGRFSQIKIYLGKQLRFFINENDWKVLPMAAIIAALVGMVIRKRFFINMEGSLIGGFALTCVAIWNGCFNSIQAVCRERPIIKREHRSGMHVTSYVAAHMIYQLFLCLLQTGLSVYVLKMMGVQIPAKGFMTPWMMLDIGITMLLITYASDMMSLFLSSISHTTTGAMTVMPFVLIFQLVFSGGIIPLPVWSQKLSNFTISNYGIKALASQSGYNELPMVTAWNTLAGMRDTQVGGTVTLGQIMDLMDSPVVEKKRDMEIMKSYTVGEAADILSSAEETLHLREQEITHEVSVRSVVEWLQNTKGLEEMRKKTILPVELTGKPVTLDSLLADLVASEDMQPVLDMSVGATLTLGQVLDALHVEDIVSITADQPLNPSVPLGDIVDFVKNNEALQQRRDQAFTVKTTVGELMDLVGEENVKTIVEKKTAQAAWKADYERSEENIINNWLMLGVFIVFFAVLSTLALELIDKDKR